jgi:hypothetical protein
MQICFSIGEKKYFLNFQWQPERGEFGGLREK